MRPNAPVPRRAAVDVLTSISRDGPAIPTPKPIRAMIPITVQPGIKEKSKQECERRRTQKRKTDNPLLPLLRAGQKAAGCESDYGAKKISCQRRCRRSEQEPV